MKDIFYFSIVIVKIILYLSANKNVNTTIKSIESKGTFLGHLVQILYVFNWYIIFIIFV